MKLPTPILLHLASVSLLAFSGWAVYEMVPLYRPATQNAAQQEGMESAKDRLARGRGQGPTSESWSYGGPMASWWAGFRQVNLVGKLPPPPPPPPGQSQSEKETEKPVAQLRPLDEVIELVSLVYDGKEGGKGGATHVIVRFKPDANVEPPEWWIRENTPSQGPTRPLDGVAPRPEVGKKPTTPPNTGQGGVRPPTATPRQLSGGMPVAGAGVERVQKVWASEDEKDPRRTSRLWPIKASDGREVGVVRLVKVAPDAQSAFFVREIPGRPSADLPSEEELIKTTMNIPQDVLAEMRRLQGRAAPVAQESGGASSVRGQGSSWVDQQETTRSGNFVNIGREDEARLRERSDEMFAQLDVDTYVSKSSGFRGVYVRSADPQLASRFGVATGDVLLEVNGRKVESKAQAIQTGKSDYNRGVRTFVTKWLTSSGQVVDRTYQAPDR